MLTRAFVVVALIQVACDNGSPGREQPRPQDPKPQGASRPAPPPPSHVVPASFVASDMLTRTFQIRLKGQPSFGSAFAADVDGRQYLITAAHVVEGVTGGQAVEVARHSAWEPATAALVGSAMPTADIAVLALDRMLVQPAAVPVTLSDVGLSMTSSLFFLGFPFGLGTPGEHLNGGYAIPLVKHAIVSGVMTDDKGTVGYYLDAINNPGFSGGPVMTSGSPPTIVAVISGYRGDTQGVVDPSGRPSGPRVVEDTGIVVSYSIGYATQLIKANPIGYKAPG